MFKGGAWYGDGAAGSGAIDADDIRGGASLSLKGSISERVD